MMRLGSLFTGYGGLDIAVEAAFAARTVWVSEVDPAACRVLDHRMPGVPNLGDITTIDWGSVPSVDILAGGSPCQDLSIAGRRAGMADGTRSNLWVSMREAIAQLRPDYVIWENVRGAYSAPADSGVAPCSGCVGDRGNQPALRALGRVLGDLASLGYDAAWCGLRASDVGAPHRRYRIILLASPAADPSGGGWGQWWTSAARCAAGRRGGARHGVDLLLPTPRATSGGSATETVALLPAPTSRDAKGRNQRHDTTADQALERFGRYAPAITRWEHVLGRSAPCPTEIGPRSRARLNAAFVEWMMGLPAGWVTDVPGITRRQSLRMLGNGVVPQQASAAITQLTDMIQGNHYD